MINRGQLELRQLTTRLLASRDRPKRKWLLERIGHIWSVPKHRLRRSFVTRHEKFMVHAEPTNESLDVVRSFAGDPDFNVRVATTFALRQRRVPDCASVPTLIPMLLDEHPVVRVNAAHALSHEARNALTAQQLEIALNNSTWSVRWTIAESLSKSDHADDAWDALRNSLPCTVSCLSVWLYACVPYADRLRADELLKSKVQMLLKEMDNHYMTQHCNQTYVRMVAQPNTA